MTLKMYIHYSLAYCLTIHKTQGMEYDNALIPMSFLHYIMHNTKTFIYSNYKSKKMCFIVGEEEALKVLVKTRNNDSRICN